MGKEISIKIHTSFVGKYIKKKFAYMYVVAKKIIFYKRLGFIERKQLLCAHLHNNPDTVILQTLW